ncbi:MAG TPA: aldo/keto reductase [Burkholderiaceae bacterium]|nr:aldo/keto reductase [Burkholderiaceae bacterium]
MVAGEVGATPAQVALAWVLAQSGVVAPIVGARTLAQAKENFGALRVALSRDQLDHLDSASAPAPIFPAAFMDRPMVQNLVFGNTRVARHAA